MVNYNFAARYSSRALILQPTITLGYAAEASAPQAASEVAPDPG
jgi:hypothetical protein